MMGGSSINDDLELASSSNEVRTLVLVGRTGNGKSATGNSILGKKAFKSKASSSSITKTCELQRTVLSKGQIVNVIDTPGLFDVSARSEFVGKEIVKCIDLAKDGIHAVLLVFSTRTRFSQEEEAAVHTLQILFGSKIVDYMIVVFTGGDELEENHETLEDYLGRECPEPLKEILVLCENRCVLFDNKTKDETKRFGQVQQLLSLVNMVLSKNGGQPFTNELFTKLKEKEETMKDVVKGYPEGKMLGFKNQMQHAYNDQLKLSIEMVESKLREATTRLELQLAKEQAARLKVEQDAMLAQMRSNEEIQKLRKDVELTMRLEQQLAKEQAARFMIEQNATLTQKRLDDEIQKLQKDLKLANEKIDNRGNDGGCAIL